MQHNQLPTGQTSSVLSSLRALSPRRVLSLKDAMQVAERQASKLLELSDIETWPTPSPVVMDLPKIRVSHDPDLSGSGMSFWNGACWVILLNPNEAPWRQRFTLMHEFKHIIDHPGSIYQSDIYMTAGQKAERVADYFAGCVLMPRRLVKKAWGDGCQSVYRLANRFDVSDQAMQFRLDQIGLTDPSKRPQLHPYPRIYRRAS